ncbi:hypothetical protein F4679DRAFT_584948 [Xylaria curta]|nr:hypothetical protein F4679DRAFT_584948 [Xylaria curta]
MEVALNLMKPPDEWPVERDLYAIVIKHPAYKELHNTIFNFPATDSIPVVDYIPFFNPSGTDQHIIIGIHHYTILTACGIITGNRFNEVYLTFDAYGYHPVATPRHGLLRPGTYYLQVRGHEFTSTTTPAARQYYIVPHFVDWEFPHDNFPREWKQKHHLPDGTPPAASGNHCFITGTPQPIQKCHIIPKAMEKWFDRNQMGDMAIARLAGSPEDINDRRNFVLFTTDLHYIFDDLAFVIVPKPLQVLPSSCPLQTAAPTGRSSGQSSAVTPGQSSAVPPGQSSAVANDQASTADIPKLAFGIHFLRAANWPLYNKHHAKTLHAADLETMCREFMFARFALALFPLLERFLRGPQKRRLKVFTKNSYEISVMNYSDIKAYRAKQGITKKGGNRAPKRGYSEMAGEGLSGHAWNPYDRMSRFDSEYDSDGSNRYDSGLEDTDSGDDGDGDGGSGGVPAPTNLPKPSTSVTAVGSSPAPAPSAPIEELSK